MTHHRALLAACRRLPLLALFAPGLALAAPAANTPAGQVKPATVSEPAAAAPANPVQGLTVSGRRPAVIGIPTEKAMALGAEAAKDKAWRDYRKSTPPLTNNPNDDSKDFPGIQVSAPK